MPDELKSFLVSAGVILALALFVPLIESIARLLRRHGAHRGAAEIIEIKPVKTDRRNVA